ncbi:VOC family protein [Rhodanobacter sp. Col0626]|uniref:VOC family protein n=1 Tax=Rhodanobacter sp. Col0626 TaxID=3415679 RepID=UPI003CF18491
MNIQYVYAAAYVRDMDSSVAFYTRLLGREPDDRPMESLVQWRGFGEAGIQLFKDAAKAGSSRMTLVIPDLAKTKADLENAHIELAHIQEGEFGKVAQVTDPDGNMITLAEPPKK